MPTELPIACSLSAGELPDRLAQMAELGRAALLDARLDGRRALLRFAAGAGIRAAAGWHRRRRVALLPVPDMDVTEEPGTLTLTIVAPEGAEPVLEDLVAAFTRRAR